jgi:hypothetical protein
MIFHDVTSPSMWREKETARAIDSNVNPPVFYILARELIRLGSYRTKRSAASEYKQAAVETTHEKPFYQWTTTGTGMELPLMSEMRTSQDPTLTADTMNARGPSAATVAIALFEVPALNVSPYPSSATVTR